MRTKYAEKKITANRKIFIFLEGILIFVSFFVLNISNNVNIPLLTIFIGLFNTIMLTFLLISELRYHERFHLMIFYIVGAIQNGGISVISIGLKTNNEDIINFTTADITSYITCGAFLLSIEYFLFVLSYSLLQNKFLKNQIKDERVNAVFDYNVPYKQAIFIYLLIWVVRALSFSGVKFNEISSYLVFIQNSAYLISMILLIDCMIVYYKKSRYVFFLIFCIELLLNLNGDSKATIIMTIFPYFIYLIYASKKKMLNIISAKNVLILFFALLFIILFVFPFGAIKREAFFETGRSLTLSENLDRYIDFISYSGNDEVNSKTIDYFMSRNSTVAYNAWSAGYYINNGPYGFLVFNHTLMGLIPRLLWPEKPPVNTGLLVTTIIKGNNVDFFQDETTYNPLGFFGCLLFTNGIFFALVFCFIIGFAIAYLDNYLKESISYNWMAVWLYINAFTVCFSNFSGFSDGGISFYVQSVLFVFGVFVLNKYVYNESFIRRSIPR